MALADKTLGCKKERKKEKSKRKQKTQMKH